MKKNICLCVDLQINLLDDNLVMPRKKYLGILRSKLPTEGNINGDQLEFTEVEAPLTSYRRNLHIFEGNYVTITLRPDGSLRLNFRKAELDGINIDTFCLEVANEIRQALKSVIGKS